MRSDVLDARPKELTANGEINVLLEEAVVAAVAVAVAATLCAYPRLRYTADTISASDESPDINTRLRTTQKWPEAAAGGS